MTDATKYKCGSSPQEGDTVKSDSSYTCLLSTDTPYKVLSVNDDASRIYIDILNFSGGLVYPTRWFTLISRKETQMKINVEAPTRPQTHFGDLVPGDWFLSNNTNSYYLKLNRPHDNPNAARSDGAKVMFLATDKVIKVIDPVLSGKLES